jgi:hypothetical protein
LIRKIGQKELVYKKDRPKGRIKPTKKDQPRKSSNGQERSRPNAWNDPSKEEKNGYPDNMPKAWLIPCTSASTQE